jgi:hypothetical protein
MDDPWICIATRAAKSNQTALSNRTRNDRCATQASILATRLGGATGSGLLARSDMERGTHFATSWPNETHLTAGLVVRKTASNLVGARWEPLL